MKQFPNRKVNPEKGTGLETHGILTQICTGGGGQNMNVKDIRERIKIMDALDDAHKSGADMVLLDNELHKSLCAMIDKFPFAVAHRDLLRIIDDVLGAETVKTN